MVSNITETFILLNYLIAITLSIVVALLLKLPFVPEKPIRFSWTKSALFPTPIFAIGILAIFYSVNFYWFYDGIILAVIIAILSGLFVKYLFDYVFPKPNTGEYNE
ncbi:MAG: energy-converting hydrogenase A subunit A EhaA [Methanobrevibacter sp.]|jgi:energy-converting hydrogenase A subunit A|nr:energy-converting hydrogenase A subunit A EhaA [Candidatus Methanovirga procula]